MRKLCIVCLVTGLALLTLSLSTVKGDAPYSNGNCNVLVFCGGTFSRDCVFAGYGNFYNCSGGPVSSCSTDTTLGTCYGLKNGVNCEDPTWPACGIIP